MLSKKTQQTKKPPNPAPVFRAYLKVRLHKVGVKEGTWHFCCWCPLCFPVELVSLFFGYLSTRKDLLYNSCVQKNLDSCLEDVPFEWRKGGMGDHRGPFTLTRKWLFLLVVLFSSPPHTKQPNNWHADFAALNNVALCGRCFEILLLLRFGEPPRRSTRLNYRINFCSERDLAMPLGRGAPVI